MVCNKEQYTVPNIMTSLFLTGYQRQLRYRHQDGSYSSFGQNRYYSSNYDVGSTWLTAFVMKSFAQAKPYVFIDSTLQAATSNFFGRNQDIDGCFPRVREWNSYNSVVWKLSLVRVWWATQVWWQGQDRLWACNRHLSLKILTKIPKWLI